MPKVAITQDRLKIFLSNRTNLILTGVILLLLIGALVFVVNIASKGQDLPPVETDLVFDPIGPYALLNPRKDGHAINLNVRRVSAFDQFSYQITYTDESGIDRGAGDLNTWIDLKDKGDFDQEILFGTCSRGNTSDPLHCVFDKGVENGTLVLEFKKKGSKKTLFSSGKPDQISKMTVSWHLQQPDVALGKITSGDDHFHYETTASRTDLVTAGWSIASDLTGAPKLPEGKKVLGKVYSFNLVDNRPFPKGDIKVELADNPPQDAKIYRYIDSQNNWQDLSTKLDGSKLSTSAEGAGIFAVLINSSK